MYIEKAMLILKPYMEDEMKRKFEGIWIPRDIWLSNELTLQEKIFLVEINSLDNDGGCYANNQYFSDFFRISKRRVREVISSLVEKKHLTLEIIFKTGTQEVDKRILKVCSPLYGISEEEKFPTPTEEEFPTPREESCHYNNTLFNNTLFNNNYIVEIIDYLNKVCGTNYKSTTKKTKQLIEARLQEGFTVEDFKTVIDKKYATWNGTEWSKYLRPTTLFNGEKFEGYVNENYQKKGGVNCAGPKQHNDNGEIQRSEAERIQLRRARELNGNRGEDEDFGF